MHINTTTPITDIYGNAPKPIEGENSMPSIGPACVNVLLAPEKELSGEDMLKRYTLAQKIAGGPDVDLKADEIVLILDCASKVFSTLVYGQMHEILNGSASNGKDTS